MKKIYMYVTDKMADWEHGFLMQALNFQNMARGEKYGLCTFGRTKDAVKTAGGVTILPDVSVDDVKKDDCGLLLLIGGDTWMTGLHGKVLGLAQDFLADGINVAAICGATAALAERGLLDEKKHTSNGLGYLKMFCRNYRGADNFVDALAVCDGNLITANCAGSLLFAKLIVLKLGIFSGKLADVWEKYFSCGDEASFFAMMELLQKGE